MANKPTRRRPNSGRLGRTADYVALGVIAVAALVLAALALSGVSLRPGINPDPTSRPAPTSFGLATPTPTVAPTTAEPAAVSLLGDQNALASDSWWSRSVAASSVSGVAAASVLGSTTIAESPLTVAELQQTVDTTTTLTGYVIVQAGSTDIAEGALPTTVASSVENLWKAVAIRGATPIVALVPPSDDQAENVVALNDLLQAAAVAADYTVLDLNTPIAASNGTWATGLSSDGVIANSQGSQILAEAVAAQLPTLVQKK